MREGNSIPKNDATHRASLKVCGVTRTIVEAVEYLTSSPFAFLGHLIWKAKH